jgi:hypothetical protein
LPFLIDWGPSAHPTDTLPAGVELVELKVAHPNPGSLRRALGIIGIGQIGVAAGHPALTARLATDRGEVTLSS